MALGRDLVAVLVAGLVAVDLDPGTGVGAARHVAGLEAELLGPLRIGHEKTVSHYG